MELENKEVLVIGLGISGISAIKVLHRLGANISVADIKGKEELKKSLKEIEDIPFKNYLGGKDVNLGGIDLIVKSPGVPPNSYLLAKAQKEDIEVISDIELGYRLSASKNIVAITGTNGKTTTTTLAGEVFERAGNNTFVVGNIGVGILEKINEIKEDDVLVIEASSFQLEDIKKFRPKVSLILNISPDHIDWHGSYENYIRSKRKIFKNQGTEDYLILNYDDEIVKSFYKEAPGRIIWFSVNTPLDEGIYIKDKKIIIHLNDEYKELMDINELGLIGRHNYENVLGSIGIFLAMGLDMELVKEVLQEFKGVEHRLEFVTEIEGRRFFNDSKGTNPEASTKAIDALDAPIILLAGGYDKAADFTDFIKSFNGKVKSLILFGQTREKIKEEAFNQGFTKSYLVDHMEEAVSLAYKLSQPGDKILLSPACASWGMYRNFEERGAAFKEAIYLLREE